MMRLPLVLPMFGVAVLLSGCANRLDTTTPAPTRAVTAAPPVYAPAPATPRTVTVVRTTSRPVTRIVRVRSSAPTPAPTPMVVAPRRVTSSKPAPCTERVLYTPGRCLPFDPCDPCAGGRCSIPK